METRLKVLQILVLIVALILILRASYLQVIKGDYYYQLSEGNRISLRPINYPRGKILDQNGKTLVSNTLSYTLYLLPNEMDPAFTVDQLLKKLSDLTGLDLNLLKNNFENNASNNGSAAVVLKRNISKEQVVILEENGDELPGILVKENSRREYVYSDLAAHVLGYVGEINKEELQEMVAAGYNYSGGDIIGKTGLEKEYELYLKGVEGIEKLEVDSRGQKVRSLGIKPPLPGNDLILNIDFELQSYVEKVLKENFLYLRKHAEADPDLYPPTGAGAIVMDPNTGRILAMTSLPSFDLNKFIEGFSVEEYQELISDPLKPLLNRITMAAVPPGSIFKLVTGTAAIEFLGVNAHTVFNDPSGVFEIGEYKYKNWFYRGEGKLEFTKAIGRSNNVVFYQLGYDLYQKYRGDKLAWTARQYGLGSKTNIDLPEEVSGLVPDNQWKKENVGEIWYPGDSVNLSIGQGYLKTTPIQLISMISAIANEGTLYRPALVDKIVSPTGEVIKDIQAEVIQELPFAESTYKILKKGMMEVTTGEYADGTAGTASRFFKDFPVQVAGKTGTAQTGTSRPNHGLFAGFAPVEDPEIAVLVFLENGNSSTYTLPIAKDIFKYYFGLLEEEEQAEEEEETEEEVSNKPNKLVEYFREVFSNQ